MVPLSQERIGELAAAIAMTLHDEGVRTSDDLVQVLAAWGSIGDTLPLARAIVVPLSETIQDIRQSIDESIDELIRTRRAP